MKYKQLKELIESYKKSQNVYRELADLGFDFYGGKYELVKFTDEILDTALKTHYTVEGIDWINWFIFETDYGNIDMKGRDSDGNPICYDMKSTYDYCEQYRFTSDTYVFNKGLEDSPEPNDDLKKAKTQHDEELAKQLSKLNWPSNGRS